MNVIQKLRAVRVRLETEVGESEELPLAGQEFVITGKLNAFSRKEAEEMVKKLGGAAGSTVTRNTGYLVVGTDPGSKLDRAQTLGIRLLTEEQFLELLKKAAG